LGLPSAIPTRGGAKKSKRNFAGAELKPSLKTPGRTNGVVWSDTVGKDSACALPFAPFSKFIAPSAQIDKLSDKRFFLKKTLTVFFASLYLLAKSWCSTYRKYIGTT
jgi:hypothetical protein